MWMRSTFLQRVVGRNQRLRRSLYGMMARLEAMLLRGHKERDTLDLIRGIQRERESLLGTSEAFHVYSMARAQSALDGDMAEVGVYQGCSARLISLAGADTKLHLFDTFAGLPAPDACEGRVLAERQYASALEGVQRYLADRLNVVFHPGLFAAASDGVRDQRFSFVHLDVDLKSSTRDCLDFFYPRMVPGGVILTHDYSVLDGVREAFTEFLAGRRERAIELSTSQAILIKA